MRNRTPFYLFLTAILVFACNLPAALPVTAPPQQPATFTASPAPAVTDTVAATISTTPFASPSGGPLNCRSGPGTSYDVVSVLSPGQQAEIVGKNPDGSWWYVKNPVVLGSFCWVSAGYVTTTGDLSGIALVAVPPTPTNSPTRIEYVHLSVNPDTINIGGCMGPLPMSEVSAKIKSNGPIKIKVQFRDDTVGDLTTHVLNFKKADIQDISDSFTPLVIAGKHKIILMIDGYDASSLDTVIYYKINC